MPGPARSAAEWTILADAFEALEGTCELVVDVDVMGERDPTGWAMQLMAEAQSGLRAAVERVRPGWTDAEQDAAFKWLRRETREDRRGILIERHMRLDDPAPWDSGKNLLRKIKELRTDMERPTAPDRPTQPTRRITITRTAAQPREYSQAVQEVRKWLQGRELVLIGGQRRGTHLNRLVEAFGLKEAHWVELSEHGTSDPIRPVIARPNVAVVLVLIRLAGHLHVEETAAWASRCDKPLVRLPGGYNPEQVASEILHQVSQRLAQALA
jgi:hypothetical protein